MKHFIFIVIAVLFLFLPQFAGVSFFSSLRIPIAHAQGATPSATPANPALNHNPGDWFQDPAVTFFGKTANRAQTYMDWMLTNYKWNYLDSSLISSWKSIRNIVYALSLLAVLITAFAIIINGGRNVGILIFTKEFIVALLLVTFSFALARLLYQLADILQVFFFRTAGTSSGIILGKDIINISFGSPDFVGYRKNGIEFDESAFISLLLIQLSSVTFYVIGSILTVRKIILWFFLISAPLYPIVLLYNPIKKTAKIWIGEFLRWLLYAPLFVLFLAAVVIIWKSNILVLPFKFGATTPLYPTAISILVGGPGQQLSLTNSLNYTETYVQYIVALLMLWVAILMPFIILQLLLDFLDKYEFGVNSMIGYINALQTRVANNDFAFMNKPSPPAPPSTGKFPTGLAREIPRSTTTQNEHTVKRVTTVTEQQQAAGHQTEKTSYSQAGTSSWQQTTNQDNRTTNQTQNTTNQQTNTTNKTENSHQTTNVTQQSATTVQFKPEVLAKATSGLINFPIPTMRDIVQFEKAKYSSVQVITHEFQQTQATLENLANPKANNTPAEEWRYTTLRAQLDKETMNGDVLAKSILFAASTLQNPQQARVGQAGAPGVVQPIPVVSLPAINQIQTVSNDDYEAVKSLWLENYQKIDVPAKYSNRKLWIEDDGEAVSQVITLLSSPDPMKVRQGLTSVSNILPFLLIGGFSQTEVISYLKAKREAGKSALAELVKKEENQETLLKVGPKKASPKELHREVELDDKKDKKN